MSIIQPYVRWIRSFSCTDGNEAIPRIAKENGLQTMVGVWLEGDEEKNEAEFVNAIELARAGFLFPEIGDLDCSGFLKCEKNVGAEWGFSPDTDVCVERD